MTDKILFVDDESKTLDALKNQFHEQYDVYTATNGNDALKTLADEGPFAVIVSDMQMPEMNGLQLFQAARKLVPDTVRLMLTGKIDQTVAIEAMNEGSVFHFLTKPCSRESLIQAISSAMEKYNSVKNERELLEGTLSGSIKLLMDMMSMVAPEIFGRTMAIRDTAKVLAKEMQIEDTWNLEMAAMLCSLGSVTLPPDTIKKIGTELADENEKQMITRLPEVSKNLISNIPRLEKVAEIVYYHQKDFNGGGFPVDETSGDAIPMESRILKVLCDLAQKTASGMDLDDVIGELTPLQNTLYDPNVFKMAAVSLCSEDYAKDSAAPIDVSLNGLREGQVLISNIETVDGRLLFATGLKLTTTIIEKVINYNQISKIKQPINVFSEEGS